MISEHFRNNACTALDVMAENVSVNKVVVTMLTFNQDQKNAVIRANIARVIDSVVTRWVESWVVAFLLL